MKTDKEYPATHSMSTAWYCADKDGNVAIFDIEDDGPVPVGCGLDNMLCEILWSTFPTKGKDKILYLPLTNAQIASMLLPLKDRKDEWVFSGEEWHNYMWSDVIVRIDLEKKNLLEKAILLGKKEYSEVICLSRSEGYYYLSMAYNKQGVELLTSNNVILEMYSAPHYSTRWAERYEEEGKKQTNAFPLFIYHQDYTPNYLPALRLTNPPSSLKVNQLPKDIQESIKRLPLRFNECEQIQLAEYVPVFGISSAKIFYDNKIWYELASSDDSWFYYCEDTNEKISREEMDSLREKGIAEEYDYSKHHLLVNS